MSKPIGKLQSYWSKWGLSLNPLARAVNCRLAFPELTTRECTRDPNVLIVTPVHPICLLNAPPKASSSAGPASLKRLTIFIDGSLHIPSEGAPALLHGTCNVVFFRHKDAASDAFSGELVDVAHFDMEKEKPSAFHPVLHAQRGPAGNLERCRAALLAANKQLDPRKITFDCASLADLVSNPYLRIPTPQLDIFALSTIIAADYFSNGGAALNDVKVVDRFGRLLTLLAQDSNMARAGHWSRGLHRRIASSQHACVAHWYPEFGG